MIKIRTELELAWETQDQGGWKIVDHPALRYLMRLPKRKGWYEVEVDYINGELWAVFRSWRGSTHSARVNPHGGQVCTCDSYQRGRFQSDLKTCKHIALIGALFSQRVARKLLAIFRERAHD